MGREMGKLIVQRDPMGGLFTVMFSPSLGSTSYQTWGERGEKGEEKQKRGERGEGRGERLVRQ